MKIIKCVSLSTDLTEDIKKTVGFSALVEDLLRTHYAKPKPAFKPKPEINKKSPSEKADTKDIFTVGRKIRLWLKHDIGEEKAEKLARIYYELGGDSRWKHVILFLDDMGIELTESAKDQLYPGKDNISS